MQTTLLSYLGTNNDPRIGVVFERNSAGGYSGGAYGAGGGSTTSRAALAPTDPIYFASVAEAYFLTAEYYARMGDSGKAKAAYNTAVALAFDRWNLDGGSFVSTGGAYEMTETTTEPMLEKSFTEWIASARTQAGLLFDINRLVTQRGQS